MKLIELTRGRFTMIDDEDFALVSSSKWYCAGYAVRSHEGIRLYLHRVLLGLVAGDGIQVDHVDNDKLNNRRENLRVCTPAENRRNCGKKANNTSGFKGVFFRKGRALKKPWLAQIKVDKKSHYLGVFATAEEAACAYDTTARELHGDFALLNFEVE